MLREVCRAIARREFLQRKLLQKKQQQRKLLNKEVKETKKELSKHQKYMKELSESGKPLVDIQTKWHEYYQNLPDNELSNWAPGLSILSMQHEVQYSRVYRS